MVKQDDFKTCAQSSFCLRQNAYASLVNQTKNKSPYSIIPTSFLLTKNHLTFDVINQSLPKQLFKATIEFIQPSTIRFKFIEKDPLFKRYDNLKQFSIMDYKPLLNITVQSTDTESTFAYQDLILHIQHTPFSFQVKTLTGDPVFQFNHANYFHYEYYRTQTELQTDAQSVTQSVTQSELQTKTQTELKTNEFQSDQFETNQFQNQTIQDLNKNMFKETWKTWEDSKPKGPESIGIDFKLPGFKYTYGLAEHASSLTLKPTRFIILKFYFVFTK